MATQLQFWGQLLPRSDSLFCFDRLFVLCFFSSCFWISFIIIINLFCFVFLLCNEIIILVLFIYLIYSFILTLGAHARGLQYLFCLCVCVSVCLPVCVFSLFWHLAQSGVQTAVSATSARYGHEGFFFKTLRSEVMASFTHLE